MRNWISLFEDRIRDALYDRFWWSEEDGFEDVNDSSHADHAVGFFSDMATGDYDDTINFIDTEEDANAAYMDRDAVRGGYREADGTGYFAANSLKLIRQCLQALAAQGKPVMAITYECRNASGELREEELDTFIRTGRIPRSRTPVAEGVPEYTPLYHLTSLRNALSILQTGHIWGSGKWNEICTTRNRNFHFKGHPVQFVLNSRKIRNRFKVEPFEYFGVHSRRSREESEERIRTKGSDKRGGETNLPLSYVDQIVLMPIDGRMLDAVSERWREIEKLAHAHGIETVNKNSH